MNIFKYWLWKRKKRIKYPKGFIKTTSNDIDNYPKYIIDRLADIQHDLKSMKYYTLLECNDLDRLAGNKIKNIKRFLV